MPTIHQLPYELLAEIIFHYNEYSRALYTSIYPDRRNYLIHWVPPMLVCHHWRKLGLSTLYLGESVTVKRDPRWLQLALSRSGDLLPDMQLLSDVPTGECATLLKPHVHRLRTLLLPPVLHYDYCRHLRPLFNDGVMPTLNELELFVDH